MNDIKAGFGFKVSLFIVFADRVKAFAAYCHERQSFSVSKCYAELLSWRADRFLKEIK